MDAVKSVNLNPYKPEPSTKKSNIILNSYNGIQSEGEVKLTNLDKDVIDLYGGSFSRKTNGGVNKIFRSSELGEVKSTSYGNLPASISVYNKNDKSEGETDIDKKTIKSISKIKNKYKKNESKLVELIVSSNQPKVKNRIKIESIRKLFLSLIAIIKSIKSIYFICIKIMTY